MAFSSSGTFAAKQSSNSGPQTIQNTTNDCHLKVGWSNWPPYQYLSPAGKPIGLQIDLYRQIADQENCHLTFILQTFSKNIDDIRSGRIDMMGDITVTKERGIFAHFSKTYRHEIQILYVKKNNLMLCKGKSLLKIMSEGFRLGLAEKNMYGKDVESIRHNKRFIKNVVYLNQNTEGLGALTKGTIDGYFEDPAVFSYLKEKEHLGQQIKSCCIEVYAGEVSLMFSKKSIDETILKRFNQAITKVMQTDAYKKRWEW